MTYLIRDAVMDLERHAAEQGWDQAPRVYALVPTAELARAEPALASMLGLSAEADPAELTPVEQEPLPDGVPLEEALGSMAWPESVAGCALVMERIVIRGSDETLDPPRGADAAEWAGGRDDGEEIRLVAGVLREGGRHSALRMRAHDSEEQVLSGEDLVPALTSALALTLDED
ncbi:PPA1309 family protein [Nocardiopsis coralliicola]